MVLFTHPPYPYYFEEYKRLINNFFLQKRQGYDPSKIYG